MDRHPIPNPYPLPFDTPNDEIDSEVTLTVAEVVVETPESQMGWGMVGEGCSGGGGVDLGDVEPYFNVASSPCPSDCRLPTAGIEVSIVL